jgi:hypothetical protein
MVSLLIELPCVPVNDRPVDFRVVWSPCELSMAQNRESQPAAV